jgi:hypothetical protein
VGSFSPLSCFGGDGLNEKLVVFSVGQVNELSFGLADVVLSGPVDVVLGVFQELDPMGNPASHAGDGEEHGVHVGGEAHGSVNEAAVEIDVGVKFSADKVLI